MGFRATVWNEFVNEREQPAVAEHYPEGIHETLQTALLEDDRTISARTATLQDEPYHGLTPEVLAETDVLIWWGHAAHDRVADRVVDRVQRAVLDGMGLVVLHSAHHSKLFRRLMGTSCDLKWDDTGERERLWVTDPAHPVAAGVPEYFDLEPVEMYGEFFDVPRPDATVFTSWFEGGEVFRSGCAYHRGRGRIFYFRPGHETFPIYHDETVRQVIRNACDWAADENTRPTVGYGHREDTVGE